MIREIEEFASWMDRELRANLHKGDWLEFKDLDMIFKELERHKIKLNKALKDNDIERIREYLADCANNLVFIANATKCFKNS